MERFIKNENGIKYSRFGKQHGRLVMNGSQPSWMLADLIKMEAAGHFTTISVYVNNSAAGKTDRSTFKPEI